ncbi:MAG TPA: antitoxin MazE family protein [Syntrophobacteraceae bacterium]|nr:antitoxin MazE family protein [Syntrophobacteraceae bacterium]
MALNASEKTAKYREKMRAQGLRPIQIWVPDVRSKTLAEEVRRQSLRVSRKDESDLMDELDMSAAQTEDWSW